MAIGRRSLVAATAALPITPWLSCASAFAETNERLVLSQFHGNAKTLYPGAGWRGFSDRVMGGISNAKLSNSRIKDVDCLRLSGNVTRESNGGFIQMAFYFGRNYAEFSAADYKGLDMLVHGNNEDYNVHVRTSDCGWHDESYRFTFHAKNEWQRVQIPWDAFTANSVAVPLDSSRLQRVAILGWMREFNADIALAELALYA